MASAGDLPNEGDILEGTIARVETYGAFCRLHLPSASGRSNGGNSGNNRGLQGLIHISQLVADQRVERVEDVISVEDHVWVKVLKVEMDPNTQRWRIQLSRKDVSQDGMATDMGLERQMKENQRDQLETNLNSMIGMGVARDPMADRLIMKNADSRKAAVFRGGYSLVGEDEGEPAEERLPPLRSSDVATVAEPSAPRLAPMGRGRGTTLPAWMTNQSSDGLTGGGDGGGDEKKNSESEEESEDGNNKKKKHKKKHSKSHKKRDRKESSSSRGRKRKRRHRQRDASEESNFSSRNVIDHSNDSSDSHRERRRRSKATKRKVSSRGEYRTGNRDDVSESSPESRDRRRRRRSRSRDR